MTACDEHSFGVHPDRRVLSWGRGAYLGIGGLDGDTTHGFKTPILPVSVTLNGSVVDSGGIGQAGVQIRVDQDEPVTTDASGVFTTGEVSVSSGQVILATRYDKISQTQSAAGTALGSNLSDHSAIDVGPMLIDVVSAPRALPYFTCGGSHVMAVKQDGTMWAWGSNDDGEILGDPDLGRDPLAFDFRQAIPAQIGTDSDWQAVATRNFHTLAQKTDGSLWAWGDNGSGQLGLDAEDFTPAATRPVRVGDANDWIQVAAGEEHSLAIRSDRSLWGWGDNGSGQLGQGFTQQFNQPAQIGTDSDWVFVCAGEGHSVAIKEDGSLWAFGENRDGQLGTGDTAERRIPVRIGSDSDWITAACGRRNTLAVRENGSVWGWGSTPEDGVMAMEGTRIDEVTHPVWLFDGNWCSVDIMESHVVARQADGTIWGWGANGSVEVTNRSTENRLYAPARMSAVSGWLRVCAGEDFTIALNDAGELWSWGDGSLGQAGRSEVDIDSFSPALPGKVDGDSWRMVFP